MSNSAEATLNLARFKNLLSKVSLGCCGSNTCCKRQRAMAKCVCAKTHDRVMSHESKAKKYVWGACSISLSSPMCQPPKSYLIALTVIDLSNTTEPNPTYQGSPIFSVRYPTGLETAPVTAVICPIACRSLFASSDTCESHILPGRNAAATWSLASFALWNKQRRQWQGSFRPGSLHMPYKPYSYSLVTV